MNVRETVEDTLGKQGLSMNQYRGYVDPVIAALENREQEIVSNLISYATEQGLSREDALNALDDCGLDTGSSEATADPRIDAIERMIADAQEALRNLRG